jgi:type II secretory pathway pseudopilin PulG
MSSLRRLRRDEHGFSIVAVMIAMMVAGLMVAAAFAAADGDLPLTKRSEDRKEALAAAQAGIQFYAFHLAQDDRYWSKCDTVPPPNATEPSPVALKWYGTGADTRSGHWRNVPGTNAQYSIELLPATAPTTANPTPQCVVGNDTSMIDPSTGMIKIRVTGRSGNAKRTLIASFRRKGLLDFLWLTNFETQDPSAYPPNALVENPAWAEANCSDYRGSRSSSCDDQQFASGDKLAGPFHTNDRSIWTCDGSTFGKTGKNYRVEVGGPPPGYDNRCGSSSPVVIPGPLLTNQPSIDIPLSNSALKAIAQSGGLLLTGKHTIVVNGGSMTVDGVNTPWPGNGVIYAQTNTSTGCNTKPPVLADYNESAGCGNIYISGTYSANLTVAAQNDVIVADDLTRIDPSQAVMGLIAENFVRIQHKVTRSALNPDSTTSCTNSTPNLGDITVQAAILSVNHSFTVDNYACGAFEGTLTVKGAIAQYFRGTVGTGVGGSNGTGYLKDYNYDDILKYRSPPYFLSPLATPWLVARTNEQVPAT